MRHLFPLLFVVVASLSACSSNPSPNQALADFSVELPQIDFSMPMCMDLGSSGGDLSTPVGSECKRNDDCAGLLVCDPRLGKCVDCRVSDDCAANSFCKNSHCISAAPCTSDVACKPMAELCDIKNGRCVDCNGAADCPGNDPKRLPDGTACLGHSCVPTRACMSTLECAGALICVQGIPPAWPTDFNGKGCTECGATSDCPSAEGCQGGLCMKTCARSGRKCGMLDDAVCGTCPGMSDTCSDLGIACMSDAGSFLSVDYFDDLLVKKDSVFVGIRNMTSSIYKIDRVSGTSRLASLPAGYINGLAANSTHLIYPVNSKVMRLPLAGGAAEQIYVNSGTDSCYSLVADDTNFYCSVNGATITQVPIAGGTAITLTDTAHPPRQIDAMFVRKDKLFYGATFGLSGATIGYVPVGGGTTQVLARLQAQSRLYADDTYLYYGTSDGDIYRVTIAGGTPELLSSMRPLYLQSVDNGLLYVADTNGNLYRLDAKTRKLDTVLTTKDQRLSAVTADGNTLIGWTGARVRFVNIL